MLEAINVEFELRLSALIRCTNLNHGTIHYTPPIVSVDGLDFRDGLWSRTGLSDNLSGVRGRRRRFGIRCDGALDRPPALVFQDLLNEFGAGIENLFDDFSVNPGTHRDLDLRPAFIIHCP